MSIPTKRRYRIGRIIGRGILTIVILLVLWNVLWRVSNNRAVARLEAAAHQRGEPVTARELSAAYPRLPDDENIHRALVKVWNSDDPNYWTAYLENVRPLPLQQKTQFPPDLPVLGTGKLIAYTNELSAEQTVMIRQFLFENKSRMEAVRAALRLKLYSANYNFDENYAMLMPELAALRREAQYFTLESYDAITAGDNPRAIAAIADTARLGHCLKSDPLLISQLVRLACYNMAISNLERLLKHRRISNEELSQLVVILDEMKPEGAIKLAMIGERTMAWSVLDGSPEAMAAISTSGAGADDESSSSRNVASGFRMLRWVGLAGAEKRLMGETYHQIIRCLDKPDHAATDEMEDIFATMEQKARSFPPKFLTMLLMPALQKADEKESKLEALRRCALTALAIERYRHTHNGALPSNLNALGTAVLEDPFTAQPLRFKPIGQGYVIYSVGPDRQDNDARLDAPKLSSRDQMDIGFRVNLH